MSHTWGTLQPETVAEYINFDPNNNPDGSLPPLGGMAFKQTEGVAFLWNTLNEHGVALLADEVGMGKTFQALAVCCLLWRSKPDAKVMVMAPNGIICQHWEKEYRAFVKEHYSQVDMLVKTTANHEPVHKARFCNHLWELSDEAFDSHNFMLTKISSLSYLTKNADKDSDLCALAKQSATDIRTTLEQQAGGKKPFDLVIMDEAQYFRTYGAGSQKHHAAQGFFGAEDGSPLAGKFLLLTATPSHRSMGDVQNIMRYFSPEYAKLAPSGILERIALRRLRLLQTKHGAFNKYQYREERPLPADFSGDVDAELFYALYQKKLVQNAKCSGRGYMYGYLEGFESLGRHEPDITAQDETGAVSTTEGKAEYYQADDSDILATMSRQYHAYYNQVPSHPKYRALVSELVNTSSYWDGHRCLLEDKHLVFVRRIPSVNELAQRVNEVYETLFAERIIKALLPDASQHILDGLLQNWQKDRYSRKSYISLYQDSRPSMGLPDDPDDSDDVESGESEPDDDPSGYKCRVLDIFTTKKDKGQDATHASRFRLRFGKEVDAFSLFFEPSPDYQDSSYLDFTSKQGKKEYRKYARSARRDMLKAQAGATMLEDFEPYGVSAVLDDRHLPTLWSLCLKLLPTHNPDLRTVLDGLSIEEKECFSRYVRAGLLFASPALIELYAWYLESAGQHESRPTYEQYAVHVGNKLVGSVTYGLWCEALTTFKTYLNKIRGIAGKHLLDEHIWNCFTRPPQQPAWFVSGSAAPGTRESIRVAFNSPFFPNVLIATSVFQEGVNLHLNCRKVNHYGMAASAGDNEQRIGRVDRLFGHINRKLEEQQHDRLLINYPFLKGTFDEGQLASFLRTKDVIVSKMDECRQPEAEKYIQPTTGDDWRKFLHTPERFVDHATTDPYPAGDGRKGWSGWPLVTYQPCQSLESPQLPMLAQMFAVACEAIPDVTARTFHYPDGGLSWLFIDVQRTHVGRQQPIVVEKHFSQALMALGSGGYFLRLKSPLASEDKVAAIGEHLLQSLRLLSGRYPLPKLALDDSHQGWFHLHLAVDLPLLTKEGKSLLAMDEIQLALEQLIHLTDELEKALFGSFDLGHERIVEMGRLLPASTDTEHSSRTPECHELHEGWQHITLESQEQSRAMVFRNLSRLFTGDWHTGATANHKTPFINHLLFGEENHVGVCFPSIDFQPEEQVLLGQVCETMVALENLSDHPNPSIQAVVTLFTALTDSPDISVARTVWNQAYRQFRYLSEDTQLGRQGMKNLVEAVAAELGIKVTVSLPFWKGGLADRNDLFGIFEGVSEREGILGLALIHYNDGDGIFSSWENIRKMTDKNLLLTRLRKDSTLARKQVSLDTIMVRNDRAMLTANQQRPWQIRPKDCLLVEVKKI